MNSIIIQYLLNLYFFLYIIKFKTLIHIKLILTVINPTHIQAIEILPRIYETRF
jgi:hypothetical protein